MQALFIEATDSSPKVAFDFSSRKFELVGESRPENAREFYLPVMNWLDEFRNFISKQSVGKDELLFKFDLEYMNSISMKFLFEILKKVESIQDLGHAVKIDWFYNTRDEDIKDNGEEFATLLHIPFKFIPKS